MKLVANLLNGALELFNKVVVNRIKTEWFKDLVTLLLDRIKFITVALTDDNKDNTAQLEEIGRQTLLTPEFLHLQNLLFTKLSDKIENPIVAQLVLGTDELRKNVFVALGDDVEQNKEQLQIVVNEFVKTEKFDELVITLVTLLANKHTQNEVVKEFVIQAITSLVNSDDNQ